MPHLFAALCDLAELALGCKTCKTVDSGQVEMPLALEQPPAAERIGGLVYLSSSHSSLKVECWRRRKTAERSPSDC